MLTTSTRKKNFEDTRWAIKSRKSKKLRQYNDQNKKEKRTSNDLQNVTQKTKDRATRPPLKLGMDSVARRVISTCSTCGTSPVILVPNLVISHE